MSSSHYSQGPKPDGPNVLLLFLSPFCKISPKLNQGFPLVTQNTMTVHQCEVFLQALRTRPEMRRWSPWGQRSLLLPCLSHKVPQFNPKSQAQRRNSRKNSFCKSFSFKNQNEGKVYFGKDELTLFSTRNI